jgi:hypothetical protein
MVFVVSIAQVILIIDFKTQQKLHFKCGNHDDLFIMYRLDESSTTLGVQTWWRSNGKSLRSTYSQKTKKHIEF